VKRSLFFINNAGFETYGEALGFAMASLFMIAGIIHRIKN
jgi:hypothetical protein